MSTPLSSGKLAAATCRVELTLPSMNSDGIVPFSSVTSKSVMLSLLLNGAGESPTCQVMVGVGFPLALQVTSTDSPSRTKITGASSEVVVGETVEFDSGRGGEGWV